MFIKRVVLLLLVLGAPALATVAQAQLLYVEGTHYEVIKPATPSGLVTDPSKVEVTEVFSYGCPFCFQAQSVMERLKASLPAYAELTLVPASFVPAEDWPMFQRAYLTARSLGIASQTHGAMFDAIWKTGELPLVNPKTQRPNTPLPSIADAARFYAAHSDVKEADFLARAQSPEIEEQMRQADQLIKAWGVPGTPAFIVAGKYRTGRGVASWDEMIRVVNFLVVMEHNRSSH